MQRLHQIRTPVLAVIILPAGLLHQYLAELAAGAFQRVRMLHIGSPTSDMLQLHYFMQEYERDDEQVPIQNFGLFPVLLETATARALTSLGCFTLPALIACPSRLYVSFELSESFLCCLLSSCVTVVPCDFQTCAFTASHLSLQKRRDAVVRLF